MILAASIVCRNEIDRYLPLVIDHLRGFCDQITVLDDGSTDGTLQYLRGEVDSQLFLAGNPTATFDQHEGRVRQALLEFTLSRSPTHVLAIDADEFIADGPALRQRLEEQPEVAAWALRMTEIWSVTPDALQVRFDGAWRPYARTHVWAAPDPSQRGAVLWRIPERKLACPPIPHAVVRARAYDSHQTIYHFGWADPETRQARYNRYMQLDAGRFHARTHLQSIMWPAHRIQLQPQPWPSTVWAEKVRAKLLP
jgi:hypothetical protein